MSRSKQRTHCKHSCRMCDSGKYAPGVAKPSDRRRMQCDEGKELRPKDDASISSPPKGEHAE